MAHIEKQRGKYRARFSDPLGKIQSRTFERKADVERFLRQVDADRVPASGSILASAMRTLRSRAGPRSSSRCADDSHRRRKRPIAVTSTSTCCRGSLRTASASCRPLPGEAALAVRGDAFAVVEQRELADPKVVLACGVDGIRVEFADGSQSNDTHVACSRNRGVDRPTPSTAAQYSQLIATARALLPGRNSGLRQLLVATLW